MGGRTRDEHDARIPARPALATGFGRLYAPHRDVFVHCRQTSRSPGLRAVRLLLGAGADTWAAASANSGRAQLRMGAEPRSACAQKSLPISEIGARVRILTGKHVQMDEVHS